VTKTAVIVLCEEAVLIWAIPLLSPQPPDFININPTRIPPLFSIAFQYGVALHPEVIGWKVVSSWYYGSSHPLYFDMLRQDFKLHRFQIMLKPDLSTASLHAINTSELRPHHGPHDFDYFLFENYRICEDTLVSCWFHNSDDLPSLPPYQCGVYTGSSARFSNIITNGGPAAKMLLPDIGHEYRLYLCPASCRFVRIDESDSVAVLDFF
jgi:hypothetical protein